MNRLENIESKRRIVHNEYFFHFQHFSTFSKYVCCTCTCGKGEINTDYLTIVTA